MYIVRIIFSVILLLSTATLYADNENSPSTTNNELLFCVTGDSRGDEKGINRKILKKLVTALKSENPSFVVVNGDLVNGYSSKLEKELFYWRDTFMAPLLDAGIKVFSCRGNHDAVKGRIIKSSETALKAWQNVFSGRFAFPNNGPKGEKDVTYFVKNKNVLLFVMDAYSREKHTINTNWMKQIIEKEKKNFPIHIFTVTHEPAFSAKHRDCLAGDPVERDKFLNVFTSNGGVCFFCGHDHFYNHAKITLPKGEFHQFICGTSGAPLYKWEGKYKDKRVVQVKSKPIFGYMTVLVNGKTATLTMKGWNKKGKLEIIDTFSYTLK